MSKSFEELISKANQKTLKNVFVSSNPFKRISALPLCTSSTAFNAAASVSGSLMISKSVRSISIEAAISRILASSPTRMAVAIFCSFAALTACSTGSSCALETKTFLKSVLNKGVGLRTGKMLSHVCVFEIEGINRLLFFTDVAFNTYPTLADKVNIINNAVEVAHACGIECPKVAPLCAVETVNPKMQPTVDADNLTKMYEGGDFKGCQIYGPLSMDLAIDPEAAVHKGVTNPVAGHADILLFPNIDAGNITYKILVRTAKVKIGNVLVGTSAPVVLTSRSDDFQTKLNSIALATVIAGSITD